MSLVGEPQRGQGSGRRDAAGPGIQGQAAAIGGADLHQAAAEALGRQAATGHLDVAVDDLRIAVIGPDRDEGAAEVADRSGLRRHRDEHRRDRAVDRAAAVGDDVETGLDGRLVRSGNGCGHGADCGALRAVSRVRGRCQTRRMRETADELRLLQELLDTSRAQASEHLRSIIGDDRALRAREIAELMSGMRVLSLATVTARGEPRISAVDGHFLHGRWTMSTDPSSAKGRHMLARPSVSVACIEGEDLAVFTHGQVEVLAAGHPDRDEVLEHWIAHYGADALPWEDIMLMRVRPTWMVGYAYRRTELLGARESSQSRALRAEPGPVGLRARAARPSG